MSDSGVSVLSYNVEKLEGHVDERGSNLYEDMKKVQRSQGPKVVCASLSSKDDSCGFSIVRLQHEQKPRTEGEEGRKQTMETVAAGTHSTTVCHVDAPVGFASAVLGDDRDVWSLCGAGVR